MDKYKKAQKEAISVYSNFLRGKSISIGDGKDKKVEVYNFEDLSSTQRADLTENIARLGAVVKQLKTLDLLILMAGNLLNIVLKQNLQQNLQKNKHKEEWKKTEQIMLLLIINKIKRCVIYNDESNIFSAC